MYILTIGRTFPQKKTGMMGIFEFEQARALGNAGHKSVYAFCDTRSIMKLRTYGEVELTEQGVDVYGFHLPHIGLHRKLFSAIKKQYFRKVINKIINSEGIPDVIHIHFPLINLTTGIWEMLKELNRPIVVTEHWTKVQTKQIELFRQQLLKRVVEDADSFICVGDPLKDSIIDLTETNRTIEVVPNMVSPLFYYNENSSNSNSSHFEFITVGRLVDVKGFDLVINAFTNAFKGNTNVKLKIVGSGPLYDELSLQIKKLGMETQISMLGLLTREETAKQVGLSDAFVSGSKLETFGVPFIEAMACGIPVIGMKGSPIDKYINSANGVQFGTGDLDSLTEALNEVYKNQSKYNRREIALFAANTFSERAVVKKIIEIYQNL